MKIILRFFFSFKDRLGMSMYLKNHLFPELICLNILKDLNDQGSEQPIPFEPTLQYILRKILTCHGFKLKT